MSAASTGFRRLVLAGTVATFALVLVGGVVRVSGSGLGCGPAGSGLAGWPLCQGDIIPGLELTAVIEYSHRLLASIVGLIAIAVAVLAVRRHRGQRGLVRAAVAAAVLVVAQGLLGAATVELNLDALLVAAHLGLAMVLFVLFLYLTRASRPEVIGAAVAASGPGVRLLAVAAPAVVLMTIVAGGYMAGTEKHGRTDHQPSAGAHYACGTEFPTCNGSFMPFGQTPLADVHLTHRALMYLASVLVVALVVAVLRRRPSAAAVRSALVVLGLLAAQILVGASNVWLPVESGALVVAHLALATALWGRLTWLGMQLHAVPAPAPRRSPAGQRSEAIAA